MIAVIIIIIFVTIIVLFILIIIVKSALALIVLGVLVSHIIFAFELFTRKFIMVK